jgi:hypothetical protein
LNWHSNYTLKRVRLTISALQKTSITYSECMCLYSCLSCSACTAHAPHCTAICGLSGHTDFFFIYIIS